MKFRLVGLLLLSACCQQAFAQCAPAPDSPYFFRNLSEQRAEAKLTADRAFYDELLSSAFSTKGRDGKTLARNAFIDSELAAGRAAARKPVFAISNYTLLEHRKGFVLASYLLTEGSIQTWLRELYEVEDGKWQLVSVENVAPPSLQPASQQAQVQLRD